MKHHIQTCDAPGHKLDAIATDELLSSVAFCPDCKEWSYEDRKQWDHDQRTWEEKDRATRENSINKNALFFSARYAQF